MKNSLEKLSIQEANSLDDKDILEYLKEYWELENIVDLDVWGILNIGTNYQTDKNFYTLTNIKTVKKLSIEYPITDLDYKAKIKQKGIYIPYVIGEKLIKHMEPNQQLYISCRLILADSFTRKRNNNPMLMQADDASIKILKQIPKILSDSDNLYIDESSLSIINKLHDMDELIVQREKEVSEERLKLEKKKIALAESILTMEESYLEEEDRLMSFGSELSLSFQRLKEKHEDKLLVLEEEKKEKKEKIDTLEVNKHQIILDIDEKKKHLNLLSIKVEELQNKLEQKERDMAEKLEKLISFIKDKADTLLALEFIDQEEHDKLIEKSKDSQQEDEPFIDFEKDLNGDFPQAISHIQMYLYNQGIIYPKYILEDYFSLIQANDLIILGGESGSGKTNLVKSFAEAVGGVSKIIPVKPNWTSSEDLLGYYNPLEKKYLSTPFLDAILEASRNPTIPYFICLDEMNLARVEYYFADFLSKLEERKGDTKIFLYSDTESGHVLSEFNNVLNIIESSKEKFKKGNLVKYIDILKDEEVNSELKRVFGFSDKDSLIKYHSDLRKMISGILDIPSSIDFPKNVRIIGAINIDETTHYLSPKVLDRANVMKFDSPLLYDRQLISDERGCETDSEAKIKFSIDDFGIREDYPRFDWEDDFCSKMAYLTEKYFVDMGIDVGFRTIRQGLNYRKMLNAFQSRNDIFINNFILHKILPKFTFDGNSDVKGRKKIDILKDFKEEIREIIGDNLSKSDVRKAIIELENIIRKSPENDGIVNYWA